MQKKELKENELTEEKVKNNETSMNDDDKDIINGEEITAEKLSISVISDDKSLNYEEGASGEESVASCYIWQRQTQKPSETLRHYAA